MTRDDIHRIFSAIRGYDYGKSSQPFFVVDEVINQTHGEGRARTWIEEELIAILESDEPVAVKQEVCRRLWRMGSDASIDALGSLLGDKDPRLVEAACYAIGRRPSTRADAALTAALNRPKDAGRLAIEHLIRDRR